MSWWIHLKDVTGNTVSVKPFIGGGILTCDPEIAQTTGDLVPIGVTEACINVTYNYGQQFQFRTELHQRRASDTIPALRDAVTRLGTEGDADYWKPTDGNVGAMCALLLAWAEQHPDAIWDVD